MTWGVRLLLLVLRDACGAGECAFWTTLFSEDQWRGQGYCLLTHTAKSVVESKFSKRCLVLLSAKVRTMVGRSAAYTCSSGKARRE